MISTEFYRQWTDHDGDTLSAWGWDEDSTAVVFNAQDADGNAGVVLTRQQVLELYHALGDHLMATEPDKGDPRQDAADLPDATADGYDWPEQPGSVATEAHGLVYGDRQGDYGHPREDFTRTAILWTGLLQHKLADGAYVEAEDIGRCMIAVKLSRDVNSPKRDNRVDMAGYAITLDRLETGR